MAIRTIIEPGVVRTWEEFLTNAPPNSIAFDGYVYGPPRFELCGIAGTPQGPRQNMNHHELVDRFSTYSSAGQLNNEIKADTLDLYRVGGEVCINAFFNDPDQDGCLTKWELENHERFLGVKSEPLFNKLLYIQDKMDIFAGAYPFDPKSQSMQEIAWVFEPYVSRRHAIKGMEASEMHNIMDAVGRRIDRYVLGKAERVELMTGFEVLHHDPLWSLVQESGPYARTGMKVTGINTFLSYRGETLDGRFHYSYGTFSRASRVSAFPFFEFMNREEGIMDEDTDKWGGGSTTGGSPRKRGSQFSPQDLPAKVNKFIAMHSK